MLDKLLETVLGKAMDGMKIVHSGIAHIETAAFVISQMKDVPPLPGDDEGWHISMRVAPNGAPSFKFCSHSGGRVARMGACWAYPDETIGGQDLRMPDDPRAVLKWATHVDGEEEPKWMDHASEAMQHAMEWFYSQAKETSEDSESFLNAMRERLHH